LSDVEHYKTNCDADLYKLYEELAFV
jgi:hypothetical protein